MAADQHEDDPEVLDDESKKDREEAEQAKALNAVTDNGRQHQQQQGAAATACMRTTAVWHVTLQNSWQRHAYALFNCCRCQRSS
jgi:hypothetical protein